VVVTAPRDIGVAPDIAQLIAHPASPRGTLSLAAASKARAFPAAGAITWSRRDVAELAGDILGHRTILTWRAAADGETARGVMARLLARIIRCEVALWSVRGGDSSSPSQPGAHSPSLVG
jgi:MoxR-like ATPase